MSTQEREPRWGVYDEREAKPKFCENCHREFDRGGRRPDARFCDRCWCYECDKDAGLCVGYCGIDGHTDEHLTDDLICEMCEEAK